MNEEKSISVADVEGSLSPTQSRWMPIETAPKAGKAFLVHCAERANTYVVFRRQPSDTFYHFGVMGEKMDETPTHWMPLPEPPKP